MADQVAPGQPVEVVGAVTAPRCTPQPRLDRHEGVVAVHHRPADHEAPEARRGEDVHERLARRGNAGGVESVPQLQPGERALAAEGIDDDGHTPLLVAGADSEAAQACLHPRQDPVGGQAVEPPVVLRTDQVQRAPVEPRHDESSVAQRGIDVLGGQPVAATAHGEPEPSSVLGLHRQQPADDRFRRTSRGAGQPLGPEPATSKSLVLVDAHPYGPPVVRRRR